MSSNEGDGLHVGLSISIGPYSTKVKDETALSARRVTAYRMQECSRIFLGAIARRLEGGSTFT